MRRAKSLVVNRIFPYQISYQFYNFYFTPPRIHFLLRLSASISSFSLIHHIHINTYIYIYRERESDWVTKYLSKYLPFNQSSLFPDCHGAQPWHLVRWWWHHGRHHHGWRRQRCCHRRWVGEKLGCGGPYLFILILDFLKFFYSFFKYHWLLKIN